MKHLNNGLNLALGLLILHRCTPGDFCVQPEHDFVFAGLNAIPNTEEKYVLEGLGWEEDLYFECWVYRI